MSDHDEAATARAPETNEKLPWQVRAQVQTWLNSDDYEAGEPPDTVDTIGGNLVLDEGAGALLDRLIGVTATAYDNTNARIGVGDSSTSESASQTGLQGANQLYKAMDATFPSRASRTVTWQATFGSSDANFDWNEWTIDNGASAALNLNRKVAIFGTKPSGATRVLSVSVSV